MSNWREATASPAPSRDELRRPRLPVLPAILPAKRPFWLWPNLLSLDAPFIAVIWQWLLLRSLHARVAPAEPVVLALCVWSIYLVDRVLDAMRSPQGDWEPERKTFFRAHLPAATVFSAAVVASIVPLAWFFLRRVTFLAGLKLALPLAAYLGLVHILPPAWRARWPRELSVACIFTLGAFLPLWAGNHAEARFLGAPAILFAALCWWNIAAIEVWEWLQTASAAGSPPNTSSIWIARHLPVLGGLTALLGVLSGALTAAPWSFAIAVALSGLLLGGLAEARPRLSIEFVRVAADLALCTPLLMLLLPR